MTDNIQTAVKQLNKLNAVFSADETKGSPFEREFVANNASKAAQSGNSFNLSPKQWTILGQINDKHGG